MSISYTRTGLPISAKLKDLLGYYPIMKLIEVGEETKVITMTIEERLELIRKECEVLDHYEMSCELKNLLGYDQIMYRYVGEKNKHMTPEERLERIRICLGRNA